MADTTIAITQGAGTLVAVDDLGASGVAQRVKLAIGASGTGVDLASGQATKANSLPVTLASDQGALAVTIPVGQAAMTASTPVVIASNQSAIPVTVPVGQAAMAASTPVVIASNQTSVPVTLPVGQTTKSASISVAVASDQLGQTTKSASLPVTLPSDIGTLAVSQVTSAFDVTNSFARSANTTAYPAASSVGGALTFSTVGPSGASVVVTGTQLEIDITAVPAGMTSFRLYLYNVTPPSAFADNAAWDIVSSDRASFLGYVDLGAPVDLGSTLYVEVNNVNKQMKLASANVYGYLVTNGGYTPASGDAFKITLHTVAV